MFFSNGGINIHNEHLKYIMLPKELCAKVGVMVETENRDVECLSRLHLKKIKGKVIEPCHLLNLSGVNQITNNLIFLCP